MKKAVVTVCIGDRFNKVSKLTHSTLELYADKIGADFIVLNEPDENPHWMKLKLHDLLVEYHRIIYLDTDLIVRDDCPDLFGLVSENDLGMFNEGRWVPRATSLSEALREYRVSLPDWDGYTYYNTGVMVVSRKHRQLFKTPEKIVNMGMWEQPYLNMKFLQDNKLTIEDIDFRFNRMTFMDGYIGITRKDSYIVHYAGVPESFDLYGLIKKDLDSWEKDKPDYKYERNLVFYMCGGLGDQLAAEPVVRYVMNSMYKDTKVNYTIISDWPRLFKHLEVPCMERSEYEATVPNDGDHPIKVMKTIPSEDESVIWKIWPNVLSHMTDYAAVCTIHKTIPDKDKDIHLKASLEGVMEIAEIIHSPLEQEMILVHPGRGWASKTFPKVWWDTVIQGLVSSGKQVGVIGKHIDEKQGYVDVDIPEGVIDFRDLYSLEGLIALLATSKVLVSNDSGPVHIAGAFDNYIVLIATCKHPDHVLPYRKGSKYHKAYAFMKKLTIDEWDYNPTRLGCSNGKETADKIIKGTIMDYLPEPEEVVAKTLEFSQGGN
jgi:hypothetical protein